MEGGGWRVEGGATIAVASRSAACPPEAWFSPCERLLSFDGFQTCLAGSDLGAKPHVDAGFPKDTSLRTSFGQNLALTVFYVPYSLES